MKNDKIIIEELKRIKSLINYDVKSTSDENSLNEAIPASIAAIPWVTQGGLYIPAAAASMAGAGTTAAGEAARGGEEGAMDFVAISA